MTTLDLAIIQAIDERVKQAQQQLITNGTVTSYLGDTDVMVTLDGSSVAIPCKCAGNVNAFENDRVVLVLSGDWWTVVGVFNRRWTSHQGKSLYQAAGTTTSQSFGDVPTPVSVTFQKMFDATRIYVQIQAGAFCTATPCETEWAAIVDAPNYAATEWLVTSIPHTGAFSRESSTDWRFISGINAGTYTVTAKWRRKSGTGTSSTDGVEKVALSVMEAAP